MDNEPFISHAEPILEVNDLLGTINYWRDMLAFKNEWMWGDPPKVGGVSWQGAFIQFVLRDNKDPSGGQSIWVRVGHINELYAMHQERGARIVKPLERQPYGFWQYVVEDPNGHRIAFAEPAMPDKPSVNTEEHVKIVVRVPSVGEYRMLQQSVGWSTTATDEILQAQLDGVQVGFTAEDEAGNAVGCALLLGDGFSFFYVKDVMVHPACQNKKVGSRLMRRLSVWLDENAPDEAFVTLFTGETLEPFYKRFGFGKGFGMVRIVSKKP